MNEVIDVQAEIIDQLQSLLASVPEFGAEVREDSVAGVMDVEDQTLPDQLIILQEGDTVEQERMPGNVKEEWTINIVAMSRRRGSAPALRSARLAIKQVLKGIKGGLNVPGLISVSFPASAARLPEPGRRWAFRVVPITFSYVQQL
ncbi:hypothetical protein D3C78_354290 [compost metagenome]